MFTIELYSTSVHRQCASKDIIKTHAVKTEHRLSGNKTKADPRSKRAMAYF